MISEEYKKKLQVLSGLNTESNLNEADFSLDTMKKEIPYWNLDTQSEEQLNNLIDKVSGLPESQQEIVINLINAEVEDSDPIGHLFFHLKRGLKMFGVE